MKILKSAIVSNSDIIKNYKTQRERAEINGKLFVFKNNQPDAVLFSISEYERVADIMEAIESMDSKELAVILENIKSDQRKAIAQMELDKANQEDQISS